MGAELIDRLEKFQAPRSWHDFIYGAILIALVLFAILIPQPPSEKPSATKAEAPSGASTTRLPLAYPLGCPEEDEAHRPLKATISIKGEKRPRCYYGRTE